MAGKIAVYESRDEEDRKGTGGRTDTRGVPTSSDNRFRPASQSGRKGFPRQQRRDEDTVINLVGSSSEEKDDHLQSALSNSGPGLSGIPEFRHMNSPSGMGRGGGAHFIPSPAGIGGPSFPRGFYPTGGRSPIPPSMPGIRPPPPLPGSSGSGFDRARDDRRPPPPSGRDREDRPRERSRDDRPSSDHRSGRRSPERSRDRDRDRREIDRKRGEHRSDRREEDRKRPRY